MPPRRTIGSSSRSLYGEPEPPVYFPSDTRLGGFSREIIPDYYANAAMQDMEFNSKRDDLITRRADNILRRATGASSLSLLPYDERAKRAEFEFSPELTESKRRMLPSDEAAAIANNRYSAAYHDAQLQDLPDAISDKASERNARIAALDDADPYSERLQRIHGATPEDIGAYEQFKELAPTNLPPRKRQEWAHRNALEMMKDKEAVAAADFFANEADDSGNVRDAKAMDLIENVTDSKGRLIGQRIKDGADHNKVASMLSDYRRHEAGKKRAAQTRQDQQALDSYYNREVDNRFAAMRLHAQEMKDATDEEKAIIRAQIGRIQDQVDQLNGEWRAARKLPPVSGAKAEEKPLPGKSYFDEALKKAQE